MLAQSFAEFLKTRTLFLYPLRPQLAQEPKLRPMGLHGLSQVVKILVLRLILGSFQRPLRPSQIGLHARSENGRGRIGFGRQLPAIHVETHLLDAFEPLFDAPTKHIAIDDMRVAPQFKPRLQGGERLRVIGMREAQPLGGLDQRRCIASVSE